MDRPPVERQPPMERPPPAPPSFVSTSSMSASSPASEALSPTTTATFSPTDQFSRDAPYSMVLPTGDQCMVRARLSSVLFVCLLTINMTLFFTQEIQAFKVKKWPSHDLISQAYCKRISFFSFEKNYTLKCFSCSADNYSIQESIRALHSIPIFEQEEKKHMHAHFRDVARLYHSYHIFIIFV